ncbi:hypothetical protein Tco_0824924 [Tanacetum coccineum]
MATVVVPHTLEYKGGQLKAAPVLEVENFTNWRFMCHIIGIEPQFENIISNNLYIPMAAGQRKPETQCTPEERKAANLDQRLKSLILSVLPDDQMNYVINCLTTKSTWDELILYHEGPSDVKESKVMDLKLCHNTFKFKEEEVSSDDNEVTEVKALMALADEERVSVSKESARNGVWIKISMKNVHTLLEIEDNDDRKSFLDYLCIDLNYVKEQRNNLMSKHRNLVQEQNTYKEQLLVLKQAKLDLLTMQHVNTEILKENQNLRNELKELYLIPKAWLNSSNKSSANNVSITKSNKPRLSEAKNYTLSNHDTGKIHSVESQRNTTDPLVAVTKSSVTNYDSADEFLVCSTPQPPPKKLDGAEPISRPKTIKSILKSKSTLKAKTLKGIILNEPSSAPAIGNKSSSASKTNSAPAGKLKNVKMEDDPPLAIVPHNALQNKYKTQFKMNSELCRENNHLSENCYQVLFCKKCNITNHRTRDHAEFMSSTNINQYHIGQGKEKLFKLRKLSLSKQCNIRYQSNPKESHLIVVKRTFCTLSLGLQYPKRSGFDLKGYLDFDCAGCNIDKKRTSVAFQLLKGKLVC